MLPPKRIAREQVTPSAVLMMERHFTVQELAGMWNFSGDFIHERFRDEPGVIHTQKKNSRGKRGYGVLRIPQSVAERVYAKMVV
jgi:hypothetical protein